MPEEVGSSEGLGLTGMCLHTLEAKEGYLACPEMRGINVPLNLKAEELAQCGFAKVEWVEWKRIGFIVGILHLFRIVDRMLARPVRCLKGGAISNLLENPVVRR